MIAVEAEIRADVQRRLSGRESEGQEFDLVLEPGSAADVPRLDPGLNAAVDRSSEQGEEDTFRDASEE